MENIKVKAYLLPHEVRRLSLDVSSGPNFDAVHQKLRGLFNIGLEDSLVISRKDGQGGFTTVSSNEELRDAITSRKKHILRLYVSSCQEASDEEQAAADKCFKVSSLRPVSRRKCRKWVRRNERQMRALEQQQQQQQSTGDASSATDQQMLLMQLRDVMSRLVKPMGMDVAIIPLSDVSRRKKRSKRGAGDKEEAGGTLSEESEESSESCSPAQEE